MELPSRGFSEREGYDLQGLEKFSVYVGFKDSAGILSYEKLRSIFGVSTVCVIFQIGAPA